MSAFIKGIRDAIAEVPDDDLPLRDGEESVPLEEVLQDASREIETGMFKQEAVDPIVQGEVQEDAVGAPPAEPNTTVDDYTVEKDIDDSAVQPEDVDATNPGDDAHQRPTFHEGAAGLGGARGKEAADQEPKKAKKSRAKKAPKSKEQQDAPAFDGALPTGSAASTLSSVDSRTGQKGGGKGKGKDKGKVKKRGNAPSVFDGRVVYTVRMVEDGWYRLRDSDLDIEQWQLSESRCGEDWGVPMSSVTLEEDLRSHILSLISDHETIWRSFIPYLVKGQPSPRGVQLVSTTGMLDDWSKR
eukprot:g5567.t1